MGTRGSPYLAEPPSGVVAEPESDSVARDLATISSRVPIVIDPNNSIWETLIPKAPLSCELNRVAVTVFASAVQAEGKIITRRTCQGIETV